MPSTTSRANLKVLIADDSVALRQRLKAMISDIDGVDSVAEAGTGAQAMEMIRTTPFDAVVLDVRMPGLNGLEVLLEIRKINAGVVIIMLTNFPYLAYRIRSTQSGADFFFDKSSEFMKVFEVLNGMVGNGQSSMPGNGVASPDMPALG